MIIQHLIGNQFISQAYVYTCLNIPLLAVEIFVFCGRDGWSGLTVRTPKLTLPKVNFSLVN